MVLMDFFDKRKKDDSTEMSFVDHLEELRWHIIRSVIAVLIGAVVVFIFSNFFVDTVIFGPTRPNFISSVWLCNLGQKIGLGQVLCFKIDKLNIVSYTMSGQFVASFTVAFVGGFIFAFPYIFWEFWRFIKPALSDKELSGTRGVIFWVSVLFFIGVMFGYFILTPFMVNFYFNYKLSSMITIAPSFNDYVESIIYTTVGVGLLFQLPLLIYVLAKTGIIQSSMLKKYRKHAFVMVIIAAAIITPSTDPFSLAIVTIPLYILYEAGILMASKVDKKRIAEEKAEWS